MGAANPAAAAARVRDIAGRLGIRGFTIAVVTGDDVRELVAGGGFTASETGEALTTDNVVSANAYLGADGILEALAKGADVVITGRVADPSLFLAPIAAHHGWRLMTGRWPGAARWSATCSNAPVRSRGATSPIRGEGRRGSRPPRFSAGGS